MNKDIRHLNRHATSNEDNLNVTSTSEMVLKFEEKPKPSKVKKKFSKEQVLLFKYLIEKYGDDYKSMARDNRNYLQHTWKQLRNKIKLFYATHQNCRFNSE